MIQRQLRRFGLYNSGASAGTSMSVRSTGNRSKWFLNKSDNLSTDKFARTEKDIIGENMRFKCF